MSAIIDTPPGIDADRFAQHLSACNNLPQWWTETKQAAWERYNALPMPGRTDENWRFSNFGALDLSGYLIPQERATTTPDLPAFPRTAEIVFSNGQVASHSTLPAELAEKGVVFAPLDEALRAHGDIIKAWFQKHPAALGGDKFVALNTAFTASGALLYVPKGVEITLPFVVQHAVSGANHSIFPHTIVVLEDNAKATLVEFFVSGDNTERNLSAGVNDLHAGAGAKLTYVGAQNWSTDSLAFQTNAITAQKDAEVISLNVHLGGRQVRHEAHTRLLGPGARSEMLSLSVADKSQEFDQRTLQSHGAPHGYSNVLYKNALLETAKTIFSGLIVVEPGAQKTDAYQSNRNLMLSDTAEANSLPGLEIEANDVRCSHGSTTSRIDPEQGFYLQSRGIDPQKAHELIVFGFFEEVLGKLEDEKLHDALVDLVRAKFTA